MNDAVGMLYGNSKSSQNKQPNVHLNCNDTEHSDKGDTEPVFHLAAKQ